MGNIISVSCGIENMVARCWDCAAGRASNTINLAENLATLKVEIEELRDRIIDTDRRVKLAERQNLQPLRQVVGWLSRTEAEILEIEEMIYYGQLEVDKSCLGVSCSRNPLSGYRFGEDVVNKLQRVRNLQIKGAFAVVADKGPSAVVEERPSEPTQGLQELFASVVHSFMDVSVGTLGIQGMGGIGKTTLLTELNNKLLHVANGYDIVIWVTVSRGVEAEMIQEEIAKRLDLYDESWNTKRVGEKALDIHKVLSKLRFVLLLDDVWERVNLSRVGVPIPNSINGSKIVFTCRSEEVSWHMEPQKTIKAGCLQWGDAWRLFTDKVGPAIWDHHHVQEYAKKMARECCGLPLALVTVGRAMASKKTVQEWHHASEVLGKCASDFSGMGDVVFPLLKFSYDALPTDRVRSCFLYCALFPGRICKTSLIDYWIGEGLLDVANDVSRLQDEGHDVIGCLINASLLQDQGESVAMHHVIRDMAIWIACEYGRNHNVIVREFSGLTEAPKISKWEEVKRMSLSANKIQTLEDAPHYSNLQTLILDHNYLKVITNDFFQHLPTLTVLDLSFNRSLVELPPGISNLALLQHLNLSMTGIRQLPSELKELVKMKCLNLDHTSALVDIPQNLISSFSKLQVLRMAECGTETEVADLQCLKSLSLLSITVKTAVTFQFMRSFHRKILSCIQELFVQNLGSSKSLDVALLGRMEHLEIVRVSNCSNLEVLEIGEGSTSSEQPLPHPRNSEIISTISLRSIEKVSIDNCPKLRDLTWLAFAPNLRGLSVSHCCKMEHIIAVDKIKLEEERVYLFRGMQVLYLYHLAELKSICEIPSMMLFPSSLTMSVRGCPKLNMPPSISSHKGFRSAGYQCVRYRPGHGFSAPA